MEETRNDLLQLNNDVQLIKSTRASYLSKEDLIKMIQELNFGEVKSLSLEVITGYRIEENRNVTTLGYDIRID